MKRRLLLIGLVSILLLSFSSCGGYRQVSGAKTFTDASYRVNTSINDYKLLGTVEVSVEWRTYFGMYEVIDKVNGEDFNPREEKVVALGGVFQPMTLDNNISKAMYKVLEQYPDADYYVPVCTKLEIEKLFLGKHSVETVKVKAYKLLK